MKNKKRTGFTLAEILMALVIMGFIAGAAVPVIQAQKSAYTSLAYYAYENLKSVTGDIMLSEQQGNIIDTEAMTKIVTGPSGFEERILKTDVELAANNATFLERKSFCEYMVSLMNTQGQPQCNTGINQFTYEQARTYTLPIPTQANIVTTNGQKYYIGAWQQQPNEWVEVDGNWEEQTNYGYRIILVDLNGEGKPNIIKKDGGSLPPDIISFAVLDTGEVLPIGTAANDTTIGKKHYRYLTSKVNGFTYSRSKNSHNPNLIPEFCTNTGGFGTRCSYSKEGVMNTKSDGTNNGINFTFRQAFCNVNHAGSEIKLKNYCDDIIPNPKCPPSSNPAEAYDVCKQEIIKPMFRFNFR